MEKIITICSSAAFFRECIAISVQLEKKGFTILLPETAQKMHAANDFDVSHYKTWQTSKQDFPKKALLIQHHFDKIVEGDAILVVNNIKHDIKGYIGGNTLMEMGLAFHLKKPIYILNSVPESAPNFEEIMGILPIFLNGDLDKIIFE
ncbi:MAG: hypothetical protein NUV65_04175 [Candidatus Roizmanbacteria bacterium]|nr:hypothetical protein [Candidatus Roizmanbacteria bacterium]